MRQILAYVESGKGPHALEIAESQGASNASFSKVMTKKGEKDLLFITVENNKFDEILKNLEKLGDIYFTVFPRGIIALRPPATEAPDEAIDVTSKSPLEIFLGGLQSIGSWKGFLGYAIAGSIVAWVGLYTDRLYLLVGAMLIAPFAGPALTLAMGTARGDRELMKKSFLRYIASIALAILVATVLSLLFGQERMTSLAITISKISSTSLLLALTSGAVGALHLCQSERDSLVTAAGPGLLVAASLAPPTGVIGMGMALGEWQMAKTSFFVLLMQLVALNVAGASVFVLFGLSPKGVRFSRGKQGLRLFSFSASVVGIILLLFWQFSQKPQLQRASLSKEIARAVKQEIKKSPLAEPVEVHAKFSRSGIKGQKTVLIKTFVQKTSDLEDSEVQRKITEGIKDRLQKKNYQFTPLIHVIVLK